MHVCVVMLRHLTFGTIELSGANACHVSLAVCSLLRLTVLMNSIVASVYKLHELLAGAICHWPLIDRWSPLQGYIVHDSSTNGTWILSDDGIKVRVPKGSSMGLQPGQYVRLSTLADGASRDTVPE